MDDKSTTDKQAHNEWIKLHVPSDRIMPCKCGHLVDVFWIDDDYDHMGMCAPCLNRSKRK